MSQRQRNVRIRHGSGAQQATMTFNFDSVFWSMDQPDEDGQPAATQDTVYACLGRPLVEHAFNGFNSCLFAYGQTGSGKTHTMMGGPGGYSSDDRGVIPRLCAELVTRKLALEARAAVPPS